MEIKKSNVNLRSENILKNNSSIGNINNKTEEINRISRRSTNLSSLTTKADEIFDKIPNIDKKKNTFYNQNSNSEDDSILENLKSKGLLNKTLENKIDEYKNDLKQTLINDKNLSKIALVNEIKLLNRNIQIANIEQENLLHLKDLKEKKIYILENSKVSINEKIKKLNDKINRRSWNNFDKNDKEENKIKRSSVKKNWKNILIQHYEIFSYDLLQNLSINREEKDPLKLEKQLTDLRINNEMQIMNLKENLKIKKLISANNKILEFEKEMNHLKNNHFFLEKNLSLEKGALERKSNKYKDLIQKQKIRNDIQSFNINDNRFSFENYTYNQRKMTYLEKINYLKNLIKNPDANYLTSNNSIMARKGDLDNCNNLFIKTNEYGDCGIKLDSSNTILFENNDFLQNNNNNRFLIKKQTNYNNLSFAIGLSNINSP